MPGYSINVPDYPSVEPTGAPPRDFPEVDATPARRAAEDIGRGFGSVGQGLENVSSAGFNYLEAQQSHLNEIHTQDVVTNYAQRATDLFSKFQALEGQSARNAFPQFQQQLDAMRKEAMEGENLVVKSQLASHLSTLNDQYYRYAATHVAQQDRTWQDTNARQKADTFGAKATLSAMNGDFNDLDHDLDNSDAAVRNLAQLRNPNPSADDQLAIDGAVKQNRGKWVKDVVQTLTDEDRPIDAQRVLERYKDGMDADSLRAATHALHQKVRVDQKRSEGNQIADEEIAASQGLTSTMTQVRDDAVKALSDQGINLNLTPGYHIGGEAGGPRVTQHLGGRALDIPLTGQSDDNRQRIVDQFLSDPRVGGFNYDARSDSIHIDVGPGDRRILDDGSAPVPGPGGALGPGSLTDEEKTHTAEVIRRTVRTGEGMPAAAVDNAVTLLGAHEANPAGRRAIMDYLRTGGANLDPATTAWCAAYVNASLQKAGVPGTTGPTRMIATSFERWGVPVRSSDAEKGDVMILSRGLPAGAVGGHVGLATGEIRTGPAGMQIEMVSGNTSNRVATEWINASTPGLIVRRAGADQAPRVGAPSTGWPEWMTQRVQAWQGNNRGPAGPTTPAAPAVVRPDLSGDATAPPATRYNNPFNQWLGDSARQFGATRSAGPTNSGQDRQAIFPDAVSGAAAGFHLMNSSAYQGLTMQEAISKWSTGATTGATPGYANWVSQQTGVPLDQRITPEFLGSDQGIAFMKAMARYENGAQRGAYPLNDAQWRQAAAEGLGTAPPAATAAGTAPPSTPDTGSAYGPRARVPYEVGTIDRAQVYDRIMRRTDGNPDAQRFAVERLNQAFAIERDNRTQQLLFFNRRLDDSLTESAVTGSTANPLSEGDFIANRKPGESEDDARVLYQNYLGAMQSNQDRHAMQGMSDFGIRQMVEGARPSADYHPGGFAATEKRYDQLQKSADLILKQRADDPAGAVGRDPAVVAAMAGYDPSKPMSFRPIADARLAAQQRLGIPDLSRVPLTKQEALTEGRPIFEALPGQEQKAVQAVTTRLRAMFGANWQSAMEYVLSKGHESIDARQFATLMMRKYFGDGPTPEEARDADRQAELAGADRLQPPPSATPAPGTTPPGPTPASAPAAAGAPALPPESQTPPQHHTVVPGDTLDSIAWHYAGQLGGDPVALRQEIARSNAITGNATLTPGSELQIPTSGTVAESARQARGRQDSALADARQTLVHIADAEGREEVPRTDLDRRKEAIFQRFPELREPYDDMRRRRVDRRDTQTFVSGLDDLASQEASLRSRLPADTDEARQAATGQSTEARMARQMRGGAETGLAMVADRRARLIALERTRLGITGTQPFTWPADRPLPSSANISELLHNPALADQFDKRYFAGAADRVLGR